MDNFIRESTDPSMHEGTQSGTKMRESFLNTGFYDASSSFMRRTGRKTERGVNTHTGGQTEESKLGDQVSRLGHRSKLRFAPGSWFDST